MTRIGSLHLGGYSVVLTRFKVRGLKSLLDVDVSLPRLTVLFGPNAAGKSNFLDALQAFSRIATSRTLSDAFSPPFRGYPIEAFSFPAGGLLSAQRCSLGSL